mmetsp:Transcript_4060/g.5180  ORF Transcript_4060/g.5180 Transcript_4060/m.5180 type:complete len:88 (-) Transcript_4060:479-742(-)
MLEGMSRAAINVQDKQVTKQSEQATSGAEKKVRKLLKGMTKPKEEKIDYLTPQRKAREFQESMRGDYSVDFKKLWQKAKVKCQITAK